jgi:hypothetical protein
VPMPRANHRHAQVLFAALVAPTRALWKKKHPQAGHRAHQNTALPAVSPTQESPGAHRSIAHPVAARMRCARRNRKLSRYARPFSDVRARCVN